MKGIQNRKGISMIETLIAIALMVIIVGGGVGFSYAYLQENSLEAQAQIVLAEVRKAQSNARYSVGDSDHGIKRSGQSIIRFRGSDYATRDTDYDTILTFPTGFDLSGADEVLFQKSDGRPASGAAEIIINNGTNTYTISVNQYGYTNLQ